MQFNNKTEREEGIKEEVSFWRKWFRSKGLQWPNEYKNRLNPNLPLDQSIYKYISHIDKNVIDILDIGCGPLTNLGKTAKGKILKITAIDPLADHYIKIIKEFNIKAPILPQKGEVEKLDEIFPIESFDFIYMSNALDHSKNPIEGIKQMFKIIKKNCYILLIHARNEGRRENYIGFHKWNLTTENNKFIIWNPKEKIIVNDILKNNAEITIEEQKAKPIIGIQNHVINYIKPFIKKIFPFIKRSHIPKTIEDNLELSEGTITVAIKKI